ncbi:MAG TPA: glycosyltransferase 87 family protein, partial [Ktedonobacterales bacterium]|nr:glycosyltransferase 87 family protein [Ktedonobacterales bacterium]
MSLSTLRARLRPLLAWLRSADGFAYLALMALALAVRLALAPNLMKSFDMGTYEYWGHLANIDLLHVYSLGGKGPNWLYYPNYPPVAIYFYGLIDKVVFGMAALLGLPLAHDVRHSSLLQVVFKLPGIIADLALLTILYVKALDALDRRWVVWLLCATYAISPGVLITVVFWGQTDGLVLLGVVVALFFALRRQPVWCGVLLALVVNFKPQPIVFAPLALVYLWRWGGFRMVVRGAIAFLGVTLLVWLPYLIPPFGELGALAHNVGVAQGEHFVLRGGSWPQVEDHSQQQRDTIDHAALPRVEMQQQRVLQMRWHSGRDGVAITAEQFGAKVRHKGDAGKRIGQPVAPVGERGEEEEAQRREQVALQLQRRHREHRQRDDRRPRPHPARLWMAPDADHGDQDDDDEERIAHLIDRQRANQARGDTLRRHAERVPQVPTV